MLYVVATPIGNLKDITLRALETLKTVDYILAEDTRRTGVLLKNFDINAKLVSFHDYNERVKTPRVIKDLKSGFNIALVSDAGTPLISDPGYNLIREALKKGVEVTAIPGPSSPIEALTLSGLPPDKFMFLGYLPKSEGKKKKLLEELTSVSDIISTTFIAFESPFRLVKTLQLMKEVLGESIQVSIARELTKMHEEVFRGTAAQALNYFEKKRPKGEITIVFRRDPSLYS